MTPTQPTAARTATPTTLAVTVIPTAATAVTTATPPTADRSATPSARRRGIRQIAAARLLDQFREAWNGGSDRPGYRSACPPGSIASYRTSTGAVPAWQLIWTARRTAAQPREAGDGPRRHAGSSGTAGQCQKLGRQPDQDRLRPSTGAEGGLRSRRGAAARRLPAADGGLRRHRPRPVGPGPRRPPRPAGTDRGGRPGVDWGGHPQVRPAAGQGPGDQPAAGAVHHLQGHLRASRAAGGTAGNGAAQGRRRTDRLPLLRRPVGRHRVRLWARSAATSNPAGGVAVRRPHRGRFPAVCLCRGGENRILLTPGDYVAQGEPSGRAGWRLVRWGRG